MENDKSGDAGAGYKNDDSENDSGENQNEENQNKKQDTPILEWITAIIGLILVIGAIGFVLYNAFNTKNLPPDLIVVKENIKQVKTGYLVEFKVKNAGNQTASSVVIEGSLVQNGKPIETDEITLDYVPSDSERKGGLYFSKNPDAFELELRAKGYEEP